MKQKGRPRKVKAEPPPIEQVYAEKAELPPIEQVQAEKLLHDKIQQLPIEYFNPYEQFDVLTFEEIQETKRKLEKQQQKFQNLPRYQQYDWIRELITDGDIQQAVKLALSIQSILRYQYFPIFGQKYREKNFIACCDLSENYIFYGCIQSLIQFKINESRIPYIQIQIMLDAVTFITQGVEKNIDHLKFGDKTINLYSNKELIQTDGFAFIQLKQILTKVHVRNIEKFAEYDQERKNLNTYFFTRIKYSYEQNRCIIQDDEGKIQCEHCIEFIDPMQELRICKCKLTYLHFRCYQDREGEYLKSNLMFHDWKIFRCKNCRSVTTGAQQELINNERDQQDSNGDGQKNKQWQQDEIIIFLD